MTRKQAEPTFASRIRALRLELPHRRKRPIGRAILAAHLRPRASESAWKNWENGTSEPSLGHLMAVARMFNVSADYLIGWDDDRGHASRTDEGVSSGLADALSEVSEEIGLEGDARRAGRQPTPARRGWSRRPES